jgi:hypothetical protein
MCVIYTYIHTYTVSLTSSHSAYFSVTPATDIYMYTTNSPLLFRWMNMYYVYVHICIHTYTVSLTSSHSAYFSVTPATDSPVFWRPITQHLSFLCVRMYVCMYMYIYLYVCRYSTDSPVFWRPITQHLSFLCVCMYV